MTDEERKLYRKSRKTLILLKVIMVLFIIILALLFPVGCKKQEKAPAPPPVAVEQPVPPPRVYQKTDEHPLKLSESFRKLAKLYRAREDSTYAVFDLEVWPNIKEDLINWSESSAGRVLYDLVLPDGRSYSIPEAFHGKLMVVFESRVLAEKFVDENKLAMRSVSVRRLFRPKEE